MSECARTEAIFVQALAGDDPGAHAELRVHIAACPACARVVAESRAVLEAFHEAAGSGGGSALEGEDVSDATAAVILRAAREAVTPAPRSRRSRTATILLAAAVLLATAVGVVWLGWYAVPRPTRASEEHLAAARAAAREGDGDLAVAQYARAYEAAVDNAAATTVLYGWIGTLVALDRAEQALPLAELLIARSAPGEGRLEARFMQARVLEQAGAWRRALTLYRSLRTVAPERARQGEMRALAAAGDGSLDTELLNGLGYAAGD